MCGTRLAENAGPKKSPEIATWAPSQAYLHNQGTYRQSEKKFLSSNMSSRCSQTSHNVVNFGPLTAEIGSRVWGTAANFNGFHVLAALLHGSQVVSVSQTLRRWTEGATYVRHGDHHVGHRPTFLVTYILVVMSWVRLFTETLSAICCVIIWRHKT